MHRIHLSASIQTQRMLVYMLSCTALKRVTKKHVDLTIAQALLRKLQLCTSCTYMRAQLPQSLAASHILLQHPPV